MEQLINTISKESIEIIINSMFVCRIHWTNEPCGICLTFTQLAMTLFYAQLTREVLFLDGIKTNQ